MGQVTQFAVSDFIMRIFFTASWPTDRRSGMQFVVVVVNV